MTDEFLLLFKLNTTISETFKNTFRNFPLINFEKNTIIDS